MTSRPRRLLLVTLAALIVGLLAASPAPAADSGVEKARTELAQSRVMLDQALDAARAGDRDKALAIAKSAYLDHFEFAEVPLRLRNPNLTLDTEFQFANLRNDIGSGAPVSQLESDVREIRAGLISAERALSDEAAGGRRRKRVEAL